MALAAHSVNVQRRPAGPLNLEQHLRLLWPDAVHYQHADTAALGNAHPLVRVVALVSRLAPAGSPIMSATRTGAGRGRREGVMLLGVDPKDEPRLAACSTLLELFARELGAALVALARQSKRHGAALTEREAKLRLHARRVTSELEAPLAKLEGQLHALAGHADGTHQSADMPAMDREFVRVATLRRWLTKPTQPELSCKGTRLNELIEEVVDILKQALIVPAGIGLELSLDAAIPEIAAPRGSVRQIVLNLATNPTGVLPAGQRISIRTEDYVYNGTQPCIGLGIAGDGPGIPPHVLAVLFEPVASGRGEGHTGMGLSITKQLVDSLGGHISCRSSARGTRFQVLLPRILPGLSDGATPLSRLSSYA